MVTLPTLPDLLRRAAAVEPRGLAILVDDGPSITYHRWERRSGAVARGLVRLGVRRGDRVALLFDAFRWPDYAVALLGVQKAAAVAVPLADLAGLELDRVLRDCQPSLIVTPPDLAPRGAPVPVIPSDALENEVDGPLPSSVPPSTLAEILYLSRPLSRPVSLPRSHRQLLAGPSLDLGTGSSFPSLLHTFPVGTIAGQEALRACLHPAPSGTVVLPTFDPERFCTLLSGGPIRACWMHPSLAQALLASGAPARHDLSGVTRLVLSSAHAPPELLLGLTAAFPRAALLTVDVLAHTPRLRTVFRHDRSHPASIGRPLGDTAVRVTDEAGRPVGPGEVGRVQVGAAPPPGRQQAAAEAAEAAANGHFGYLDDQGFLYVVTGRNDLLRCRTSTLIGAEVESALQEHPTVVEAAVFGVPDDLAGGELAAAVVLASPAPGSGGSPAPCGSELRALVRDRLGENKTPKMLFFVEELPRNRQGMVLRSSLRRRLGLHHQESEPVEAPTAVEETVASTWRRVLDHRDVGLRDDFFELGGHWFAASAVLSLLEDAFEVRLPLTAFLDSPTIAGLAAKIEGLRPALHEPPPRVAFSQEGMIWHERFAPGCQNLPGLARRYRGPLDVGALGRALDEIMRRHEALRTNFELRDGRLVQVVRPHRSQHLPISDLTSLSAEEREEQVERLVQEAGRRPFDLATEALFEPTLLRLADDEHVLVIRTHHSVFDDWSVGVFRRELAALYAAFVDGEASPLPELPLQFTDFSRHHRGELAGPRGTRELSFWRRELSGAPLTSQLPIDDPNLAEGAPQNTSEPISLVLTPALHEGLRALARRGRATVFMTMLAAFGVLVQRYVGQDDLLLASVVANRNRTELEALIGCFTKKVPLRLRLDGDPTFVEALTRVRGALLGALSHQDLPFEAVVQDVLGGPAAAHGLVPHVVLMFQGVTPRHELVLRGVETTGFETSTTARRGHFMAGAEDRDPGDGAAPAQNVPGDEAPPTSGSRRDPNASGLPWGAGLYSGTFLILSVVESDDELSCMARGVFHGPAVRELMASFQTLLADIVADPTRNLSELAMLDGETTAEVVKRGRGPVEPLGAETLPAALAAQVRRGPDELAVGTRTATVTYAELDAASNRLAHRLRALGIGPGARVGVSLESSPDVVVAVLAAWKVGAAWVGLDPRDADDRLAWILRDASIEVVVGEENREVLARHARVVAAEAGGVGAATASPSAVIGPDDVAVVFYGSGPSAVPHGIALCHRSLLNLLAGLRRDIHRWPNGAGPTRRVCLSCAPTQDGFLRQLTALLDGHPLYVPDGPLRADPSGAVSLLAAGEIDLLDCTPEELEALLTAGLHEALAKRDVAIGPPVLVLGTRAAPNPELWRALGGLTGLRGHVLYGPPECAFGATSRTTAEASLRPEVGRPLANVSSHVLDTGGQPVPTRAVGELHLGGPSLAHGYLGDPKPSRERFVESALEPGSGRLYRTGQRARTLPDGHVELLGAKDAEPGLRGFRIEPARLRSALNGCPGVRDLAVTVRTGDSGEPRLVAYVVADGQPPTPAQLRAFLWSRLPGYACPSEIVVVPHLPPEGDGEVATRLVSSAPGHLPRDSSAEQSVLTSLWADVLGAERITPEENYWQAFSFLEVLARARDAGLPIPGEQVTRNRTVETLAADLAASRRRSQPEPHESSPETHSSQCAKHLLKSGRLR